jgi:two-component system, OmpR family, response regulator RegX3
VVTRTAAGALELAEMTEPDLVMLDLALPDGDGRDVCRELRRRSDVPMVMLSARGTEMDKIVGLELGADDYVVKPFSAREVISRIRAVMRRSPRSEGATAAEPIRVGELELDPAARIARLCGEELDLSRKEFDLLAELMRHAGHVVKREDLMSKVWDVSWFGSTRSAAPWCEPPDDDCSRQAVSANHDTDGTAANVIPDSIDSPGANGRRRRSSQRRRSRWQW